MMNVTMDVIGNTAKKAGYLFYIMNPREHCFKNVDDVTDYYKEVTPIFLVTVILEQVILYYQRKPTWKLSVTVSNTCHGMLMELSKIPFKGAEVWVYAWVFNNYRLITLPWNSPWTWIFCWIFTDFCYYWMHRLLHQVNILWAIHETHHTPEEMSFTAPMRNHIFLLPIHWLTYLPMALAIPPATYLVHYQISILFQYWLHTEIFPQLPAVIEYIFSTPSHHRVHHGYNRRYIDKNFGGFLIIWDRLFGTYEDEIEKPVYGTTTQIKSLNPLVIQTSHFVTIWKKFCEAEGIGNKLSAIFKGPGWSPGKPWYGSIEDIPEPPVVVEKYNPILPTWCKYYVIVHFALFVNSYMQFILNLELLSKNAIFMISSYLTYTTFAFGFILDMSPYALPAEYLRIFLYFAVDRLIFPEVAQCGILAIFNIFLNRVAFAGSLTICTMKIVYDLLYKLHKEKMI